jgi:hypothetical protein
MKTELLKKLIKEAVSDAIKDELKDILLEAIKTNKPTQVNENKISPSNPNSSPSLNDLRSKYAQSIGGDSLSFTTKDLPSNSQFNPTAVDPVNGNLGTGEVSLDSIMGLLNSK